MIWLFACTLVGAAAAATFVPRIRQAALALWLAGFSIGGIYLTIGAELLAIVQWILSTLIAVVLIFFAIILEGRDEEDTRSLGEKILASAMALGLGSGFVGLVWLGSGNWGELSLTLPKEGNDLASLGKVLTNEHFLSLQVLALILICVLIGTGVVARGDKS